MKKFKGVFLLLFFLTMVIGGITKDLVDPEGQYLYGYIYGATSMLFGYFGLGD